MLASGARGSGRGRLWRQGRSLSGASLHGVAADGLGGAGGLGLWHRLLVAKDLDVARSGLGTDAGLALAESGAEVDAGGAAALAGALERKRRVQVERPGAALGLDSDRCGGGNEQREATRASIDGPIALGRDEGAASSHVARAGLRVAAWGSGRD